jgi:hypothetical protein
VSEPSYFFVTSYGRTATVWLTRALNLHPDILCSHGPSFEPIITRQGERYGKETVVQAQQSAGQFYALSLRQILANLSALGQKKCVGNVHAYTAFNLDNKRKNERDAPLIRCANLLRHPVTRVDSFWRRWQYEKTFNAPITKWIETEAMQQRRYQEVLEELRRQHDAPIQSFVDRAFFHAVMQMSTDHGDLSMDTTHIVSERLVADIDYFAYMFELLTSGVLAVSSSYLNEAMALGRQNASEGGGQCAVQVFEQWEPWQRTLFLLFLRDHPSLVAAYPKFGYGLPSPLAKELLTASAA